MISDVSLDELNDAFMDITSGHGLPGQNHGVFRRRPHGDPNSDREIIVCLCRAEFQISKHQVHEALKKVRFGLNEEQWARRATFEKGCSCHISPPCGNCVEHSELFPEEY